MTRRTLKNDRAVVKTEPQAWDAILRSQKEFQFILGEAPLLSEIANRNINSPKYYFDDMDWHKRWWNYRKVSRLFYKNDPYLSIIGFYNAIYTHVMELTGSKTNRFQIPSQEVLPDSDWDYLAGKAAQVIDFSAHPQVMSQTGLQDRLDRVLSVSNRTPEIHYGQPDDNSAKRIVIYDKMDLWWDYAVYDQGDHWQMDLELSINPFAPILWIDFLPYGVFHGISFNY